MKDRTVTDVRVRPSLLEQELPMIMSIEERIFGDDGWDEDEFRFNVRRRRCMAHSIVDDTSTEGVKAVLGYIVSEINDKTRTMEILNIAVLPDVQREGLGSMLFHRVQKRRKYDRIVLWANEHFDSAHWFFAAMGMRAVRPIVRGYRDEPDLYKFVLDK